MIVQIYLSIFVCLSRLLIVLFAVYLIFTGWLTLTRTFPISVLCSYAKPLEYLFLTTTSLPPQNILEESSALFVACFHFQTCPKYLFEIISPRSIWSGHVYFVAQCPVLDWPVSRHCSHPILEKAHQKATIMVCMQSLIAISSCSDLMEMPILALFLQLHVVHRPITET